MIFHGWPWVAKKDRKTNQPYRLMRVSEWPQLTRGAETMLSALLASGYNTPPGTIITVTVTKGDIQIIALHPDHPADTML